MKPDITSAEVLSANISLSRVQAAFQEGRLSVARSLSRSLLRAEVGALYEAQAHLFLARCDLVGSRFRRAHVSARAAVRLFSSVESPCRLEAEAFALFSYTCSVLGKREEALEAALMSLKLCDGEDCSLLLGTSYNYLGLAYLYSWDLARAEKAFLEASTVLLAKGFVAEAWLPRTNYRYVEVWRVLETRGCGRPLEESLQKMSQLREEFAELQAPDEIQPSFKDIFLANEPLLELLDGFEYCWSGRADKASEVLNRSLNRSNIKPFNPILSTVQQWVQAELLLAQAQYTRALTAGHQMLQEASRAEHEPLLAVAKLLLSCISAEAGQAGQALEFMKRLWRREQALRSEAAESRFEAIGWRLQARETMASFQKAVNRAKMFEVLSLEDPLTQLANRRKLEQWLPDLLSQAEGLGAWPVLAVIDVDQFKSVNDKYSHRTGDLVLKTLASLLTQVTRAEDLPVRVSGDEFVVVFKSLEALTPGQLEQRIAGIVSSYDWDLVCEGLKVTVSVGIAQAVEGDTVDTLLHRADLAMYARKHEAQALSPKA